VGSSFVGRGFSRDIEGLAKLGFYPLKFYRSCLGGDAWAEF